MSDIWTTLIEDADRIAEEIHDRPKGLAAEKEQIQKRLAEIEDIEKTANAVFEVLGRYKVIHAKRTEPLCPIGYLTGHHVAEMKPVASTSNEDVLRCSICGHEITVQA